MQILVIEPNLFWSVRLMKSIAALGHAPMLASSPNAELPDAEVAIVNLGAAEFDPPALVPRLRSRGIYVIGHAGHKELDLRAMGRAAGCDRIASNSEMTFKLEALLTEAAAGTGAS